MMGVLNLLSALFLLSFLPPGLSHVVERFSDVPQCEEFFQGGKSPNITGILVNGEVQDQNRYKPICQRFKKRYTFATLYDTTNRIPVFSAYTYTRADKCGRPNPPWMMEPQLEGEYGKTMTNRITTEVTHQAVRRDYTNNNLGMDKGHLFPCSYAPDNDAKKSTFTLTNAVPQASSFNRVSWRTMEGRVKKALEESCVNDKSKIKAYLVTGAVPSQDPMKRMINKVNIPSKMWTAFMCQNIKGECLQGAYMGDNVSDGNASPLSLEELQDNLAGMYQNNGMNVELFPNTLFEGIKCKHLKTIFEKQANKRKFEEVNNGSKRLISASHMQK